MLASLQGLFSVACSGVGLADAVCDMEGTDEGPGESEAGLDSLVGNASLCGVTTALKDAREVLPEEAGELVPELEESSGRKARKVCAASRHMRD